MRVAAEDYLDHCGAAYRERTSPDRVPAPVRIDRPALRRPSVIRLPVTLVAVDRGPLVPRRTYELVERLRGETRLRVLRSLYGHDAFLKEEAAIAAVLREALDDVAGGWPHEHPQPLYRAPCAPASTPTRPTARSTPPILLSTNFSFAGFNEKRELRLHAQRQSHARPAGRSPGRARRRRRRGRHRHRHGRDHAAAARAAQARRPAAGAARLLRRQLAPVQCAGEEGRVRADHSRTSTDPRALAAALAAGPAWSGSRRRPTRCCVSPIFASSSKRRRHAARWRWSTTPSCRRRCSSRSRSARISSCIRRPSTSTATATWSAAR